MNTDTYNLQRALFIKVLPLAFLVFLLSPLFSNNPVLQLTCPNDITVELGPGQCNTSVVFDTAAWSSTEPLVDTIFAPPSGTFFGIGTFNVLLAVTTSGGIVEDCFFKIIVNEFIPSSLDCRQNLSVSLNGACERIFTPSELLFPNSAGCINNFQAARLNASGEVEPPNITAADIGIPFLGVVQHLTNNMQCLTQITVTGGTPPSITCPADVTLGCNSFLFPSITGFPDTTGCFENISVTYSDETAVTLCADSIGFQTTRTWVATDPLGNIDVCKQIITGKRLDVNLVEFPPDYDGTDNMSLLCVDGLSLQEITQPVFTGEPTVNDVAADNNATCDISSNFIDHITNICGETYDILRIWTVINLCNPSEFVRDTQYIQVIDTLPPMFSIPDTLYASVSTSCYDSLFLPAIADVVECSSFGVEIVTPWDTLYTNGGWTPIDQTAGTYSVVYTVSDDCGNTTIAASVLVIDNETLVACPSDLTIDCDFYYETIEPAIGLNIYAVLNELGVPEFHGNCDFTFTETDSASVDGCGAGSVFRTLVSDSTTMETCVQKITVEHVSDFSVLFPIDTSICTSPIMVDLGEPIMTGVSCENMVIDSQDEIIPNGLGGCYTIERTWTITNACSFNNVNTNDDLILGNVLFQDGGDGIVEHKQTIYVNDVDAPVFTDSCGLPNLYLFPTNCEITITVPTPGVEGCGNVELSLSGDLGTEMGANVNLVPGTYEMIYTAIDECGKIKTCMDEFEVIDSISPMAVCKQGVTFELMNVDPAMVQIWASDLDDGSTDNCGGQLEFYFLKDTLEDFLIFGCCDLGLQEITLVVVDQYGNQSPCETSVIIQYQLNNCDECNPSVSGIIKTENGEGINAVEISINNLGGNSPIILLTDTSGVFSVNLPPDSDYTIIPIKNNNHINGVTTFDAVKLTRHILNVELLDSPYKIIAADINNSKSVTTFDIVVQRKLILNIYSNYPNNSSWRFVPADYVFPNPLNPFEEVFPEVINVNNLMESMADLDFIGIKIGDVNNSADPNE